MMIKQTESNKAQNQVNNPENTQHEKSKFGSKQEIEHEYEDMSKFAAKWYEILPCYLSVFLAMLQITVNYLTGNMFFETWIGYVFVPILDYLLPVDHKNLSPEKSKEFEKDSRFLIPLYLYWLIDVISFYTIPYYISIGKIATTTFTFIMYAYSYAQIGSTNAVVGHELIHRRKLIHKVFGTLAYSKMIYSHFLIHHIRAHHKMVATQEDAVTARLGEGIFQFWCRAIPNSLIEVWNYESKRLQRDGFSKYSLRNRVISFNLGHVIYLTLIYLVFGNLALAFHLVYSLICVLQFESVNYIEHYGLLRKKDENGNYESIQLKHSWNAPQYLTSLILFKLQRHSDHHANVYKPYQTLDSFPESPMLPYGYAVSLILAYNPPIWKAVVDPISIATNKDEKVSEEFLNYQKKLIFATLLFTSILFTYINFCLVGFPGYCS